MADDAADTATLLASVSDIVLTVTPAGRLDDWNRALLTTTGLTTEEVASRGLPGLFVDTDPVHEAVTTVVETGEDEVRFDAHLETADGSDVYEFVATPDETAGDADTRVVLVGRDVTEARRRQRELERFEVILESVPDAVYAIESDGTIRYVNEQYCRMKGTSREELVGTDIDNWVLDEVIDDADRMRAAVRRGERDTGVVEYDFVTVDGDRFPAELRFSTVDEASTDLGRVGMIRDVSERVERERQLARQNERLEEFASIVSHDLRNPLNVAEGRLELARTECDSDHLDAIERAHGRMRALIESLLTLAKQGQEELDRIDLSLSDVVRDCWDAVVDTDATLVVDTDATVFADETQLRRLVENLLRNSVEHGSTSSRAAPDDTVKHGSTDSEETLDDAVEHGGSSVTVTVGDLPDGFYVADDGPGIPPSERDRIFESGYSTSDEGTGFGLSIVRDIADAHGWDVSVSETETGGARFEFRGL